MALKILVVSDNRLVKHMICEVLDNQGADYSVSAVPESGYDLIISAHSKTIFDRSILDNTRCINIHPGLNPWNRGMFPHVFSILNGLPAGATIHEMDEHIDNGKIIVQRQVDVLPWDTSETLYERVLTAEVELFEENYDMIIHGRRGNYNSMKDYKQLCRIDSDHTGTMQEHIDLLRALSHPPHKNAYMEVNGRRIYIEIKLTHDNSSTADVE